MNKKGPWWIAVGVSLIALAFAWIFYNLWLTNRAGERAEAAVEKLEEVIPDTVTVQPIISASAPEVEYPDYVLNPNMEMPIKEMDGSYYIGILEIPSLDIKLPVQSEWNYSNMNISPCRYQGSIYLDNMVICGHNYATHFRPLFNIENGTSVYFTDMDGNRFEYQVRTTEILDGTAVEEMVSGDWDLTLFTCTPGGVSRVTVRCARVDAKQIG